MKVVITMVVDHILYLLQFLVSGFLIAVRIWRKFGGNGCLRNPLRIYRVFPCFLLLPSKALWVLGEARNTWTQATTVVWKFFSRNIWEDIHRWSTDVFLQTIQTRACVWIVRTNATYSCYKWSWFNQDCSYQGFFQIL